MLREAKEQCDYPICGLQVDPSVDRAEKNALVQTIVERYTQLKAVGYVDEIVPTVQKKIQRIFFRMYPINIRILGEEYRDKDFTGKDIWFCKRDIEIHFNKRDHALVPTDLRERVCKK